MFDFVGSRTSSSPKKQSNTLRNTGFNPALIT